MLVCKNCHSENADGTIKCIQCNMEGNFIHVHADGTRTDYQIPEKQEQPQCLNCGTEAPGHGDNCVACNFPMPKPKSKPMPKPISKPTSFPEARKRNYSSFHPWEISNQKTG